MTITIPLQIIDLHGDGFHPILDIYVFGSQFKLVLDTGASKTAFDKIMIMQANANALLLSSDRLSTGLGTNTMVSFTAQIEDLYLDTFLMPVFEVAVLDLSAINIAYEQLNHPLVLGVLGGDILMQYKAVIDYGKQALILEV